MQIKGYIEIICWSTLSNRWKANYDIVELIRYKGDLWWVYGTTRNESHEISGLPHIATWHFYSFDQSSHMYEENNLGLALKYEVHHLERVWCRNDPMIVQVKKKI